MDYMKPKIDTDRDVPSLNALESVNGELVDLDRINQGQKWDDSDHENDCLNDVRTNEVSN